MRRPAKDTWAGSLHSTPLKTSSYAIELLPDGLLSLNIKLSCVASITVFVIRVRLFDAAVTPSVLYACSTWALTKKMETKLQVTRRRMLRYVFQIYRRNQDGEDEDWVDYLRRAKLRVNELSAHMEMEDWVDTHRRRKWQFAGKLARQTDNRWSQAVVNWKPNHGHGRLRGHPATRWIDQLENSAGGDWQQIALDAQHWDFLQEGFVTHDRFQ